MGTVFSIDVRDPVDCSAAIADVVTWLHEVDRIFSTYRSDSDVSRLRRGDITLREAAPAVSEVLEHCALMQRETDGYFTALWSGALDPTGLVKGWAIEQASEMLRAAGSLNHAVNGGGDIQVVGEAAPGEAWRIGVSDPADRARVLTVVSGRDFAIATSGRCERGDHVFDPFTRRPAVGVSSVTVVGSSLTYSDAYATAAVAMGTGALPWLTGRVGYGGLVVARDGSVAATNFPGGTCTWSGFALA
jgi:thiamine biosynthesis lipoprotein